VEGAVNIRQVGEILEEMTAGTGFPVPFTNLLRIPLSQPGKTLSGDSTARWPEFVFACCSASGGSENAAPRVAAAVELLIAALDVLDDVEDGDASTLVAEVGPAQALNVSTALLFLSHQALATLPQDGVAPERIPAFLSVLTQAGASATAGQHLDLSSEGVDGLSTQDAHEIARRKAGALAAGACRLGALTGTDNESLLDLYEDLGRHLGTMAQLENDLHDAQGNLTKTDIERRKPTMPLVFGALPFSLEHDPESIAVQLMGTGALHFTWVVIEIHREECRKILVELENRGQLVTRLAEIAL
jgi:geranylgeranyl diphosphate synthase, type I